MISREKSGQLAHFEKEWERFERLRLINFGRDMLRPGKKKKRPKIELSSGGKVYITDVLRLHVVSCRKKTLKKAFEAFVKRAKDETLCYMKTIDPGADRIKEISPEALEFEKKVVAVKVPDDLKELLVVLWNHSCDKSAKPVQTIDLETLDFKDVGNIVASIKVGCIVKTLSNPNSHSYRIGKPYLAVNSGTPYQGLMDPKGDDGNCIGGDIRGASNDEIEEFFTDIRRMNRMKVLKVIEQLNEEHFSSEMKSFFEVIVEEVHGHDKKEKE